MFDQLSNLILRDQTFTLLGCKDIGIIKSISIFQVDNILIVSEPKDSSYTQKIPFFG